MDRIGIRQETCSSVKVQRAANHLTVPFFAKDARGRGTQGRGATSRMSRDSTQLDTGASTAKDKDHFQERRVSSEDQKRSST